MDNPNPSTNYVLTKRVRGPYCKLRTECLNQGEKRGSVTYSKDCEKEDSDRDIYYICEVIRRTGSETSWSQEERSTATNDWHASKMDKSYWLF